MPLFSLVNAYPTPPSGIITSGNTVFGISTIDGRPLLAVPGVSLESIEYETEEAIKVAFETLKRGKRQRRMITVAPEVTTAFTITLQHPVGRWLRGALTKFMKPGVICPFTGVITNTCAIPCDRYALIFPEMTISYLRIEQLVQGAEVGAGVPANSTLYGTDIRADFYVRERLVATADGENTIAYWQNECDTCSNCCEDAIVGGEDGELQVTHDGFLTLTDFTAVTAALGATGDINDILWIGNLVVLATAEGIAWFTYEEGDDPATVVPTEVAFANGINRLVETTSVDYKFIGVGDVGNIVTSKYGTDWTLMANPGFATATFLDVDWSETRNVGYIAGFTAGVPDTPLLLEVSGTNLQNITADLTGDGFADTRITAVHVADNDDYVIVGSLLGQLWANVDIDNDASAWVQEAFTGGAAVLDIDGDQHRLWVASGIRLWEKSYISDLDWRALPAPSGVTVGTIRDISMCVSHPEAFDGQSYGAFITSTNQVITFSPCDLTCSPE